CVRDGRNWAWTGYSNAVDFW
nr:immunoglobulin heavy chain junction region [Macaca mulatta]MOX02481.1 immunoglobulin heavy chain junction region [Macaca mulatta]MOX03397.1 immunoglobulin heavy chain junction region [Macaca mulatta]MOX04267.1 immunoglobulin heavy chain junction region [Macaca mulatta]